MNRNISITLAAYILAGKLQLYANNCTMIHAQIRNTSKVNLENRSSSISYFFYYSTIFCNILWVWDCFFWTSLSSKSLHYSCPILAVFNRGGPLPQPRHQIFTCVSHLGAFCSQSAPCWTLQRAFLCHCCDTWKIRHRQGCKLKWIDWHSGYSLSCWEFHKEIETFISVC